MIFQDAWDQKGTLFSLLLHAFLGTGFFISAYINQSSPPPALSVRVVSAQDLGRVHPLVKKPSPAKLSPPKPLPPKRSELPQAPALQASKVPPPLEKPKPTKKPEAPPQKQPVPLAKKITPPQPVKKSPQTSAKTPKDKPSKTLESVLDEKAVAPEENLSSLLDNLSASGVKEANGAAQQTLMQEVASLQRQLIVHWNIPSEIQGLDMDLAVEIQFNEDGTMKSARVLPTKSSTTHPYYKALETSVMRAINSPDWLPVSLPRRHYATWKTVIITFNPKDAYHL